MNKLTQLPLSKCHKAGTWVVGNTTKHYKCAACGEPCDILAPSTPTQPKEMPSPTKEDLKDPVFNAIWKIIKHWDVAVPEYYGGYCEANGSHVMLILNAIRPLLGVQERDRIKKAIESMPYEKISFYPNDRKRKMLYRTEVLGCIDSLSVDKESK